MQGRKSQTRASSSSSIEWNAADKRRDGQANEKEDKISRTAVICAD
jgi:hypothetical protein